MTITERINNFFTPKPVKKINKVDEINFQETEANGFGNGGYRNLFSVSFDGSKNLGEIGPIIKYRLDYDGLRLRSWQALIESEVVQTIIGKYCTWVIGAGLKLTSEPATQVLKSEGIELDGLDFSNKVEQRFNLYKASRFSDYSKMENLDSLANTAFLNSIVGGDVLVVLRYDGKNVTTQLIDGEHVQSPHFGSEYFPEKLDNGNQLINGIEINANKQHVRYWIRNKDYSFDKIEAIGKSNGLQMAFLVKGLDFRLDNIRGIPLISAVLEKLKKMERYESATLSSAEENAKIAYTIEHTKNSTGESPLTKALTTATNWDENATDLPKDTFGNDLANQIATSTNKQVFNMGLDSSLKIIENKNPLYFKDYYDTNIVAVCAALGIPYQVAMCLYEGNFSASRAALKDWENTLNIARKKFGNRFYQPIFNFWLEVEILNNKIPASGYLLAKMKGNEMAIESFRKCRFVGNAVPHIDPLKEVKAVREALGDAGKNFPLITVEQATEILNGSESEDNIIQFAAELEKIRTLKIEPEEVKPQTEKPAN